MKMITEAQYNAFVAAVQERDRLQALVGAHGLEPVSRIDMADLSANATALVAAAKRGGLVLTVEQRSLQPLAMGHYETVVSVRPAR